MLCRFSIIIFIQVWDSFVTTVFNNWCKRGKYFPNGNIRTENELNKSIFSKCLFEVGQNARSSAASSCPFHILSTSGLWGRGRIAVDLKRAFPLLNNEYVCRNITVKCFIEKWSWVAQKSDFKKKSGLALLPKQTFPVRAGGIQIKNFQLFFNEWVRWKKKYFVKDGSRNYFIAEANLKDGSSNFSNGKKKRGKHRKRCGGAWDKT